MKILILTFLMLGINPIFAQETTLQTAFEKSYISEKSGNFNEASKALINFCLNFYLQD